MPTSDKNKKRGKANRKRKRELREKLHLPPGWKVKRDKPKTFQPGSSSAAPKRKSYKLILSDVPASWERRYDKWRDRIATVLNISQSEAEEKLNVARKTGEVVLVSSDAAQKLTDCRNQLIWVIDPTSLKIREE